MSVRFALKSYIELERWERKSKNALLISVRFAFNNYIEFERCERKCERKSKDDQQDPFDLHCKYIEFE